MSSFINHNAVFLLAILGAIITFLIFLIDKLIRKQKLKLLIVFTALGFLAVVGRQVIEQLEKRQTAILEEQKGVIIGEIRQKVTSTLSIVEQISAKLSGISPETVGIELVPFIIEGQIVEFYKGSPSLWFSYSNWLETAGSMGKRAPCLSITIRPNAHYNVSLILAYLYNNSETKKRISEIISSNWRLFPDSEFLNRYGSPKPDVKYVLFYNGTTKTLLGYADATVFAKELLLYAKTNKANSIEALLNDGVERFSAQVQSCFSAYSSNVVDARDANAIAQEMLTKKINEVAAFYQNKLYIVQLSSIIKRLVA